MVLYISLDSIHVVIHCISTLFLDNLQLSVHIISANHEAENQEHNLDGSFSFYTSENPYQNMTVDRAQKVWRREGKPDYTFTHYNTHSFMDKNPNGEDPVWYWFSQDRRNLDTIYIIGFWGYGQLGLCEMKLNQ